MKILLVDDEAPARDRLRALLAELPEHQVIGSAGDASAALSLIEERLPDVVITDIRMPGMDGLELARHVDALPHPPAMIFLTAFDDRALAAFDLHAVDYLLKPVRLERLKVALERARRLNPETTRRLSPDSGPRSHLCVRIAGNLKLVPVDDVWFFMADTKYVQVVHRGGEVLVEDSLVQLEQEFVERFVRIHRNCLVAVSQLAGLERALDGSTFVRLKNHAKPLEVSRRNLSAVRQFLRQF